MRTLTFQKEVITPAIAQEYLRHNTMNRGMQKEHLRQLAKEMTGGRWRELPNSPITFADDGTLVDGQHRLMAITTSGTTVACWVLRGVDKADFLVIDMGRKRTGGDTLSILHCPNATTVASAINYYFSRCNDMRLTTGGTVRAAAIGITTEDIVNEYQSSAALYDEMATFACRIYHSSSRLLSAGFICGIAIFLIKQRAHDPAVVKAFFEEVCAPHCEYEYLLSLQRRLLLSKTSKLQRNKVSPQMKVELLAKAWNYYLKGARSKGLSYNTRTAHAHFD